MEIIYINNGSLVKKYNKEKESYGPKAFVKVQIFMRGEKGPSPNLLPLFLTPKPPFSTTVPTHLHSPIFSAVSSSSSADVVAFPAIPELLKQLDRKAAQFGIYYCTFSIQFFPLPQ